MCKWYHWIRLAKFFHFIYLYTKFVYKSWSNLYVVVSLTSEIKGRLIFWDGGSKRKQKGRIT